MDRIFQRCEPIATCRTDLRCGSWSSVDCHLPQTLPTDATLTLSLSFARATGIRRLWLRLHPDGAAWRELAIPFAHTQRDRDTYTLTVTADALLGASGAQSDGHGAFCQYEVLAQRGEQTLFARRQGDGSLCFEGAPCDFVRLLFYSGDYRTPDWLKGATMYHVFVDRFARGAGEVYYAPDAILCEDWEHGQVQYPPYPGAPLKNNLFFGGNLWGMIEKLDYLCDLGVTVLYLSPIFRAKSNHKYDTGDYREVDLGFGGDRALDALLDAAHARGIRVILDGVFNHTGDDSRFFNRYGSYDSVGAYQSVDSPFFHWYRFRHHPDDYECWWNIPILPRLCTDAPDCADYFLGQDGVVAHYLARGVDGWRLDVADELSEDFLYRLRARAKATRPDAAVIGEVWENAADKIAYGARRHYLQGGQLDSVMNYPFRDAVLAYLQSGDACALAAALCDLYRSYPRCVSDALMNLLGTHDTARIATVLGGEDTAPLQNDALAVKRMPPDVRARALTLLRLASVLQYTVFGFPSVFYGDEVGMEGYGDPFCRRPYPWHAQDTSLLDHYRRLGALRRDCQALHGGDFTVLQAEGGVFVFAREKGEQRVIVAVNCGQAAHLRLPRKPYRDLYRDLYRDRPYGGEPLGQYEFLILG